VERGCFARVNTGITRNVPRDQSWNSLMTDAYKHSHYMEGVSFWKVKTSVLDLEKPVFECFVPVRSVADP
jgi:hypothetical protein